MSPKIFISYRRGGVKARTYRMADELKRVYGAENVFLDVDSIEPGAKFADAIRDSINSSSVVLIIIGPKWLDMKRNDGDRRLDDKTDNLRIEVETALNSNALVIPVLVDGATMPVKDELPMGIRELAQRHAYSLSDSHWSFDIEQLVEKIGGGRRNKISEKMSAPAVVSLLLSAMVAIILLGDDYDSEELLGCIVLAIAALVLSVFAYRKLGPKESRNRTLCVVGLALGGLLLIASWIEYASYDEMDYEPFDQFGRHETSPGHIEGPASTPMTG